MDEGALHRALVEQSFDLAVVIDDDARIVWAGPQAERTLGYRPADVVGAPVLDFVHPDDRDLAVQNLSSALAGIELVDPTLLRVRHADGTWRWLDTVGGSLADRPGLAPASHALHLRDVTHRYDTDRQRERTRDEAEAALRLSEQRHRALLRHSADSIVVITAEGRIDHAHPDVGLFGPRPSEQVLGADAFDFVHEPDRPGVEALLADLLERAGDTVETQIRVRDRDDRLRWISVTGTNMLDDPSVQGVVINYRDVTARVEAERDNRRLLDLLEATEDLVGVCDPEGHLLHLNRAARSFSGFDDDADLSEVQVPGRWLHPVERSLVFDEVLPALDEHGAWSGELRLLGADGSTMPVLARMVAHRAGDGDVEFFSWIMRDISDRKAVEARLAHQATHDPLTGLPNRTLLLDRLDAAITRAERAGTDLAVVFVDLDHFKVLNDTRGHAVGDRILREMAGRLARDLRPEDTIARYGGDEFVVVLEHLTDPSDATDVAGRIQRSLASPIPLDGEAIDIGASIGIALVSDRRRDGARVEPDDLLRAADMAMYRAKGTGRGRMAVFDPLSAEGSDAPVPWWTSAGGDGGPSTDGTDAESDGVEGV